MKQFLLILTVLLPFVASAFVSNSLTTNNNAVALGIVTNIAAANGGSGTATNLTGNATNQVAVIATNVVIANTVAVAQLGNTVSLNMTNMSNSFSGNGGGLTNILLSGISTNGYTAVTTNAVNLKIPFAVIGGVTNYLILFTNVPPP